MGYDEHKYRHWQINQESDGILWLSLDQADKDINTLSSEVLEELSQILDDISRRKPSGVVICSGKPDGFIAGADVTEFSAIVDSSEALKLVEGAQSVFDRLEQLPCPTVCLVQGFCLGGGLELALACRCRIAVDTPKTRFGLPEVKLGIHPGFGGTVRLTRLIGPLRALNMMLSGKSIDARRACKIGLVDCTVPGRERMLAARSLILHPPFREKHGFRDFLFSMRLTRFLLARYLLRRIAKRANRKQYPAPYAVINLWKRFGGDAAAMFRAESRSVASLLTGVTARNLARVFLLQERLKAIGQNGEFPINSVHVIGGGTMGGDIAAWCALQGLRVTIQDVSHKQLEVAAQRASRLFREKIREPRLAQDAVNRLTLDMHGKGIAGAGIVIEAIFEDAKAKQRLYQEIEPQMRQDAVLATNTSSIPLEELAEVLRNPGRFVGLHFFNPVAKMQLVEVVRGKAVDAEAFNKAIRFVGAIKRLPLPVISSPGFLINRILMPYLLEAVTMEQEGIPAADIDRAAGEFGMPMGPMLLADSVGLDICLSAAQILAMHFRIEVPKRLENLVANGALGKKSGRGFYIYKRGKPIIHKGNTVSDLSVNLTDRLMLRLLNEAIACLRQGIVADGDLLDAGAVFGMGFPPFRGGPLNYIRAEGIDNLLARLKAHEARYGGRFAADPGWRELCGPETKKQSCLQLPGANCLSKVL
jgi:3-hydroxyacyl-CoA dehydrogenase/enoyl-CoA hydratase/3-hydroxybutyryl-CoA epimerase